MYLDYHTHSFYSFDGEATLAQMAAAAHARGLREMCCTDHLDFDTPVHHIPDFQARAEEVARLAQAYPELILRQGVEVSLGNQSCAQSLRQGVEVSLGNQSCAQSASAVLAELEPDFVLGSVHTVNGVDVWDDPYYEGRSKQEAYRLYLETIAQVLPLFPAMNVLAHYDFVAKYAPYPDRSVTLDAAPEAFDMIFRWLADGGLT